MWREQRRQETEPDGSEEPAQETIKEGADLRGKHDSPKQKLGVHHLLFGKFQEILKFRVLYFDETWDHDMETIGETSLLDDSNIKGKISERNTPYKT